MVAPINRLRWLIVGGQGQLGRAMAFELDKNEIEYISLSRNQLDITNRDRIYEEFERTKPDVVLNAAAWTNVDLAETHEETAHLINAEGPMMLAAASANRGAKYIQVSTDYVFSGISNSPWNENAEVSPISVYGRTKADGEELVLNTYPEGSFVVRTAWLYSPWGRNFAKTMLRIALCESKQVDVVNDQVGQPTSALDLAAQLLSVVKLEIKPGIYHGTNSGQTSWFDFAQEIFSLVGQDPLRINAVSSELSSAKAKRPINSVLGLNKWREVGMDPMQNWQTALSSALPALLRELEQR